MVSFGLGQRGLSVFGKHHTVPCFLQKLFHQHAHILAIIHYQDVFFLFGARLFVHNAPCLHVFQHYSFVSIREGQDVGKNSQTCFCSFLISMESVYRLVQNRFSSMYQIGITLKSQLCNLRSRNSALRLLHKPTVYAFLELTGVYPTSMMHLCGAGCSRNPETR